MASSWTPRQNKLFEKALALYDRETPDRWQNVAKLVGKSMEDVKMQYDILKEDVERIEHGQVPYPPYRTNANNTQGIGNENHRLLEVQNPTDSPAYR